MFKLKAEPTQPVTLKGDLLRGVKQIADFLGEKERRVFYMCETGQLEGVFKIGRLWHARRSTLIEEVRRREEGGA
jgi:hypothetical protein